MRDLVVSPGAHPGVEVPFTAGATGFSDPSWAETTAIRVDSRRRVHIVYHDPDCDLDPPDEGPGSPSYPGPEIDAVGTTR